MPMINILRKIQKDKKHNFRANGNHISVRLYIYNIILYSTNLYKKVINYIIWCLFLFFNIYNITFILFSDLSFLGKSPSQNPQLHPFLQSIIYRCSMIISLYNNSFTLFKILNF